MGPFNPFGGTKIIFKELTASEEEKRKRGNLYERVKEDVMNDAYTKLNYAKATSVAARVFDSCRSMSVAEARRSLTKGDHIYCNRTVYSHHGIYDGNDKVYEYNEGVIRHVSLRSFADGDNIIKLDSPVSYSQDEIIRRAKSRLGERDYDLVFNNCEHFCRWCRNGHYFDTDDDSYEQNFNYDQETSNGNCVEETVIQGLPAGVFGLALAANQTAFEQREKQEHKKINSGSNTTTVAIQTTKQEILNQDYERSAIYAGYDNGIIYSPLDATIIQFNFTVGDYMRKDTVLCLMRKDNIIYDVLAPYDITIDEQFFYDILVRNNNPVDVKIYDRMYKVH